MQLKKLGQIITIYFIIGKIHASKKQDQFTLRVEKQPVPDQVLPPGASGRIFDWVGRNFLIRGQKNFYVQIFLSPRGSLKYWVGSCLPRSGAPDYRDLLYFALFL